MGFSNRPSSAGKPLTIKGPTGSNVRFPQVDGESIDDFIKQFSSAVRYWKAIQCPCMNGNTGQPNISCNQCRGLGWFHTEYEKDPIYQRAQVHSRRSQKQSDKGGMLTTGYASITFLPGVIPGEGDLIQVCEDREVVNDEYHVIGSTLTDGSTAETLRFRDVVCVEMVAVEDKLTKKILILERDRWTFNEQARRVELKDLPRGTRYSLRYVARPEYVIRAETAKPLLRVTHDDGLPEPQRYTKDIVYPFNVQAVRLDRAIIQRQRGAIDLNTESTFNNAQGRGPFR